MIEKFKQPKAKKIITKKDVEDTNETRFFIEKLDRGFGNSIGVPLRRVLLSSIPGVSVFAIEIDGVDHEFSTISGVREDVAQIILNIKNLIFEYNENSIVDEEVFEIKLEASKKGEILAKDLVVPGELKITNKNLVIANTNKDDAFKMKLYACHSKGYKTFEENRVLVKEKLNNQVGIIPIDSNFSPIEKINFFVEEVNPGESRVFERLVIDITTKGNVDASKVLATAAKILGEIFAEFSQIGEVSVDKYFIEDVVEEEKVDFDEHLQTKIETLNLSARSTNALKNAGIVNIEQLINKTILELKDINNLGETSIKEIIDLVKEMGLSFKSE